MGIKVAAYGEFMAKHNVCNLKDINLLSSNYKDNKKYNLIDSFGGTECDMLAFLSSLGVETRYATCFGKDELSKKAIKIIKNMGVDTSHISFNNSKIGEYYFLNDCSVPREKATKYFRKGSAINKWNIKKFDFDKFFEDVKVFHVTGISFSLDNNNKGIAYRNGKRFLKEAKKRNINISLDINYRSSIWNEKYKNNSKKALASFKKCITPILEYANILLLSKKDLTSFLNYPETKCNDVKYIKKTIFKKLPNLKYLVIRDREKVKQEYNTFNSCIMTKTNYYYNSDNILFPVIEPIGGGDAFAAGIIYGIIKNKNDLKYILDYANKAFVIKHQIVSDYANKKELNRIMRNLNKNKKLKILIGVDDINDQCFIDMKNSLSNYCEVVMKKHDIKSLKGYDVLVDKKLSKNLLDSADRLKAIFVYKTGVEDFPLKELKKRKIKLYNSHCNTYVIARYTFGLLVSLLCQITKGDNQLRKDIWNDGYTYWELFDEKKIGILGYGSIGQEINNLLSKFNIDTYTIKRTNKSITYKDVNLVKDFNELIDTCDVIISSLPATKDTNNIFTKKIFNKMKGKYLINVGRGNIYKDIDLYNALKNNILAGAAVDTWKDKPAKGSHKKMKVSKDADFSKLNNIILSPHQAMRIESGHKNYVDDTQANVINYILGNKVHNEVNLIKGY